MSEDYKKRRQKEIRKCMVDNWRKDILYYGKQTFESDEEDEEMPSL